MFGARLVTLTGAGGVGKSRLALRLAATVAEEFADGVWHVDLAPLAAPKLVPHAVVRALGIDESGARPPVDMIVDRLRSRRTLLLLDNCEHLLQPCAELIDAVLRAAPEVRIVATSREPIRVEGEVIWRVPSLSLSRTGRGLARREQVASEAFQLFVDRARCAVPDFEVNDSNADAIAAVCSRLDGIPLAIELAAARLRSMTVSQLSARLDDVLGLLIDGSRTAQPRHRTLRATLEWSHQLLTEHERELFERMAVFAGGWTPEAAEAICTDAALTAGDVFNTLSHLVDKSLVGLVADGPVPRYRLLETMRQFGEAQLRERDELDRWRARHAAYFLELAEGTEAESWGPGYDSWWRRLEAEIANLRAALRWLIATGHHAEAQRLGASLARFWKSANHRQEGSTWLSELLELTDGGSRLVRARLLIGQGDLLVHLTDLRRAEAILREALTLSRELDDPAVLGFALFHLCQVLFWQGQNAESRALGEEGAARAAAAGLRMPEYLCLQMLCGLALHELDYTTAKRHAERALSLATAAGYPRGITIEYMHLGRISMCMGELSAARSFLEAGLANARQDPWPHGPVFFLTSLGAVATAHGDVVRARECLRESLSIARERRLVHPLTEAVEGRAKLAVVEHRPRLALRLAAAAAVERERHAAPLPAVDAAMLEPYLARARRALGRQRSAETWTEGARLTLEQAVEEALLPERTERHNHMLTRREVEVADYAARGLSSREIAASLVIGERTVETYLERIYSKLDVHSRAELATWVAEQQRLQPIAN